jgi:co-chaperonin GroES (HSP10)
MNVIAVDDKIVVKQLIKNVTKGGLFLPDSVKTEPQNYGRVISVGDQVKNIKEGDVIMYHPKGGMALVLESYIMAVVKYSEVYAIIEGDDALKQFTEQKIGKD